MWGAFKKKKIDSTVQMPITPVSRPIGTIMTEWKLTAPEYIKNYEISYYKDYMYVKIYYTIMNTSQKNELFVQISELETNWKFLGVREYIDNHEMCFVFRKDGYKINA